MISVNQEKCIGCGTCAAVCPAVFKLNEEIFKAEVIGPESTEACAKDAADMCPVQAISNE